MNDTYIVVGPHDVRRGDRVLVDHRPGVVSRVGPTTLEVRWRDAWYWRLAWMSEDAYDALRRWLFGTEAA